MLTIIRLTINSNFTETISACLGCYGLLAPQFVLKSGNGPVFFLCVCHLQLSSGAGEGS